MRMGLPDGYTLLRPLGQGASARVWLAQGPAGPVALKVAADGATLAPEIEVLRRTLHPYVARLLDADPGGAWLATEHAEHGRIDTWTRGQPLPVLVELAAQVAEALQALHLAGLVHGDLKPANVLVARDGSVRLVDMGASRRADAATLGGTLGYVAPEVMAGRPGGPAADIWALGALLYQLLTHRHPYDDGDPAALAWLPTATLPLPPSALRPRLPRALDELVLALLARNPDARPAAGLPAALRASLASEPAPPVVGMARERETLRRHVVELLGGAVGAVVLHGPEGSGRRTLIREAVRAAMREGVRVLPPIGERSALLHALADGGPAVVPLDGNAPGAEALAGRILSERLPCLLLVRADRPLMRIAGLGGRHLTPTPLAVADVTLLLEGLDLDRRRAEDLQRRSRGHPGTLLRLLTDAPHPGVPPEVRAVLDALGRDRLAVDALASRLGLGEHRLLDLVEPLLDQGVLEASDDGVEVWVRR